MAFRFFPIGDRSLPGLSPRNPLSLPFEDEHEVGQKQQ
jgi:hypothetical protein